MEKDTLEVDCSWGGLYDPEKEKPFKFDFRSGSDIYFHHFSPQEFKSFIEYIRAKLTFVKAGDQVELLLPFTRGSAEDFQEDQILTQNILKEVAFRLLEYLELIWEICENGEILEREKMVDGAGINPEEFLQKIYKIVEEKGPQEAAVEVFDTGDTLCWAGAFDTIDEMAAKLDLDKCGLAVGRSFLTIAYWVVRNRHLQHYNRLYEKVYEGYVAKYGSEQAEKSLKVFKKC